MTPMYQICLTDRGAAPDPGIFDSQRSRGVRPFERNEP